MTDKLVVISLGAGVQSSTLALMAAHGEVTPMPYCAVFADTQDEPKGSAETAYRTSVYRWLDWLEKQLPFPIRRVTAGSLKEDACLVRTSRNGVPYAHAAVPAYLRAPNGDVGLMMRQCTLKYKILVINRELAAIKKEQKASVIHQWLGISRDEVTRMKHNRVEWIHNEYPLVDARMTRGDCRAWIADHGYPQPPRSACSYCPMHSDKEWRELKTDDPDAFAEAVQFEKDYQEAYSRIPSVYGTPWLHRSCKPLNEIDFADDNQLSLFSMECGGYCGL